MFIVPSRGRPQRLLQLIDSFGSNDLRLPVVVVLSADDETAKDYFKLKLPLTWGIIVDPTTPGSNGAALNFAYRSFPNAAFYGLLADDVLIETKDRLADLAKAAGRWFVSAPNEGHHENNLFCYPVLGGELVRTLGWIAFPPLQHNCIDSVIDDIAKALRLDRYFPDIKFIAKHPAYGNAPSDATYERADEFNKLSGDSYTRQWHGIERAPTLNRIKAAMAEDKNGPGDA